MITRILTLLTLSMAAPAGATESSSEPLPRRLIGVASRILDEAQISYVYGGYQVGDDDTCKQCNACLDAKSPAPKQRLKLCPVCSSCSLDCSHFTAMVFKEAGAPYPYLDTATMLSLSGDSLLRRYGLVDLGTDVSLSAPGDLLVYDGHVVMLEKRHAPIQGKALYRGDIVHATGGKDVRGPGEGIQRERFIDLANFRGTLRRVLRHKALSGIALTPPRPAVMAPAASAPAPKPAAPKRLRPVAKRQPNGD